MTARKDEQMTVGKDPHCGSSTMVVRWLSKPKMGVRFAPAARYDTEKRYS